MQRCILLTACVVLSVVALRAQTDGSARYEVVSIKRNANIDNSGGMMTRPDGYFQMTNQPIRSIISMASPVPVREVIGYPDWVSKDRYDIIAKPPAGYDRTRYREMERNLLIDYMKVEGHIEQREQNTFALVLARKDGKLGPGIQPSTVDCSRRPANAPPLTPEELTARRNCGYRVGAGAIEGGSMTLDDIALPLGGAARGLVNNRTGLEGRYAITLKFAIESREAGAPPDDAPNIFTAVQEQLGLKLVPEKSMVPVFVVDHIERPIEN